MFYCVKTYHSLFLLLISSISCVKYNLFGYPGQGYVLEMTIGHPPQQMNVLVDTGSSTLAIAATPHPDINAYFHPENSNTNRDSGKPISAQYSQGQWTATLANDFTHIPSLPTIPEVKSDIALINRSKNFFMNGSLWQGIVGLAYPAITASGLTAEAEAWLDGVDRAKGTRMTFTLELCGIHNISYPTHYGSFQFIDEKDISNLKYRTPILHERWYEIGVLSVRVIHSENNQSSAASTNLINTIEDGIDESVCLNLNQKQSILDSGTTNIRLPEKTFRKVADELRDAARLSNTLILDKFWYDGDEGCWPEEMEWALPWIGIDLLDAESNNQYFTLRLPPKSYMRLVSVHRGEGMVPQICYKFGLEPSTGTILGVVAFEGLNISFNRKEGWISFETTDCGPAVTITGPHHSSAELRKLCDLNKPVPMPVQDKAMKVAKWTTLALFAIGLSLLSYILSPWLRARCISSLRRAPTQFSLSRAALVTQENA